MKASHLASALYVCALFALLPNTAAMAYDAVPDCLDKQGEPLDVMNEQVLQWKDTTEDQTLVRAHIRGTFLRSYADRNGHKHFKVQIGATAEEAIEIVYNQSFGRLPAMRYGAEVEVCGDYITSIGGPNDRYPASPDKAIIHWVHRSNSAEHKSGYVLVNDTLYGQGEGRGD